MKFAPFVFVGLLVTRSAGRVPSADAETADKPPVLFQSEMKYVPSVFTATPPAPAGPVRKLHAVATSVKVVANSPSIITDNDRAEFAVKAGPNENVAGRPRKLVLWFDSNRAGFAPAVDEEWIFELTEKGEFYSMKKAPRPAP